MTTDPAANPLVAHFYRAVVSHADVWRQRMDATTNWAAATTAGMVTFAFGTPDAPHVVLLLAAAFDIIFLLMESRRYQVYDLWRQRFRTLNRFLIAPVLCAWLLKLEMHPAPAQTLQEFTGRAAVGTVPGEVVFLGMAVAVGLAAVLAARAPSEGMVNWTVTPSPMDRLVSQSRRWVPGGDPADGGTTEAKRRP